MNYIDDEYTALDEIFDEKQREKKMIPIQVFDDIKSEIRQKQWHIGVDNANNVIEIIDKHLEGNK